MNILLIGTGRMAYHLGHAIRKAGHTIVGITGRDAQKLADMSRFLQCPLVRWNQDWPAADVTVIATSDDAIAEVSARLKPSSGLVLHTAGAVDMDVLAPHEHRGVLWPVQTLSHGAATDLSDIPLMVDGNTPQARETVLKLARSISESVLQLTHAQRQRMHLAAAITSNLPVFLVREAQRLLRQENLPPDLLMPLWRTTAANVSAITTLERSNSSVAPFDLSTLIGTSGASSTRSNVVNRCPPDGQRRRRRTVVPSAATRESTTLVSSA